MDTKLPETTIVNPAIGQSTQPSGIKKKLLIIGSVILLLILISGGIYYYLQKSPTQPPEILPPPPPKLGATFLLEAEPQEATLGGQIKITVQVKSDLDAANLFIAKLKFPNLLLQAKSINLRSESSASGFIKDWFISNWVENTFDNNTGSVSLVGAVPNPGFQTQPDSTGSAMADVIFMAKAPGDAMISFDDTSSVYRNSDNINILVSKKDVTVKITGEVVTPPISATPSATLTPTLTPTPIQSGPTPTPTGPPEGDVNQDGKLDFQDLSTLLSMWGKKGTESSKADLNNDGVVNAFDYSRLTKILKDAGLLQ